MSHFQMPYQCLSQCGSLLVAARGSSIDLFNLKNGSLISTWDCPLPQDSERTKLSSERNMIEASTENIPCSATGQNIDRFSPPAKKRKLSEAKADVLKSEIEAGKDADLDADLNPKSGHEAMPEPNDQKKKKSRPNNRSNATTSGLEAPFVVTMTATRDYRYVVVVTGEDKSIRVLENIEKDGTQQLKQVSLR